MCDHLMKVLPVDVTTGSGFKNRIATQEIFKKLTLTTYDENVRPDRLLVPAQSVYPQDQRGSDYTALLLPQLP